jgi:putative addiction module component (TIGR02574 family)
VEGRNVGTLLADLEKEARRLPADERARLAEVLLESLQGAALADVNAAWDAEIAQRVAAFERGELETHLAEDVFAEAHRLPH